MRPTDAMEPYFTRHFWARIAWLVCATGLAFVASVHWLWPTWWWFVPGGVLLVLVITRAIQQGTNNLARRARDDY